MPLLCHYFWFVSFGLRTWTIYVIFRANELCDFKSRLFELCGLNCVYMWYVCRSTSDIWYLNCKSGIDVKTLKTLFSSIKKANKIMYILSFKFVSHVSDEINVLVKYFRRPLGRQNSINLFHRFRKPVKKLFLSTFVNWRKYIFSWALTKNMYDSVEVSFIVYFRRFANKKACFRWFTLIFIGFWSAKNSLFM